MHWRPDAITRTGVIQPMWVRQQSPVNMATHTIDPFLASVRGRGPAVNPGPSPEDIAYAAGQLASQFAQGKSAVVSIGMDKVTVSPGVAYQGIIGVICNAAMQIANGRPAAIEVNGRRVIINGSGGQSINVTQGSTSNVTSSASSGTVMQTAPAGFGGPAGTYNDFIRPAGPGRQFNPYRTETSDSPYRQTMMSSVAQFAPNAAARVHGVDKSALYLQRTDPAPALASRPALPAPYYNQAKPYTGGNTGLGRVAMARPTTLPMQRNKHKPMPQGRSFTMTRSR